MSERKCPKCGGDMEEGFLPVAPHLKPGKGIFGLKGTEFLDIDVKIALR